MPEEEKKIEDYFKYVCHHLKDKEYSFEAKFFDFVARRLFARTEIVGLDELVQQKRSEEAAGKKTITIYIARHLSEFDWQEIQRILAIDNIMACVQAGDNLFIGPMDPLLRHHGGFKVFRDEAKLFSDYWLTHSFYVLIDILWKQKPLRKIFNALGLKRKKPLVINANLARDIYTAYIKQLIEVEGRDILMFPEYTKTDDGKTKYGRSYSGKLLEFTPLLFRMLRDLNKKTDIKLQFVPVNVSYERVVEDQMFQKLEEMKSHRFKKRFTYLVDYFFNYTHWMYQRRKGMVAIKFGKPIALRKKMDFKVRLHEELRKKVGELQVVFPTQILGYAFHDDTTLTETELLSRVDKTMAALKSNHADVRFLEGLSSEEIVRRAYAIFNQNPKRRILTKDRTGDTYTVLRPEVLSQYDSHIAHLFETWHVKDQFKKIIDFFR